MITFETLNKLSKNCVNLIVNAKKLEVFSSDKKLSEASEQIIKSLRKITIANELYGKQVICISGLQGAGKTTLMKNFYELDDDILNISLGRGEKIPVFISEKKEWRAPEMYVKELVKENGKNNIPEYSVREKKITKQEFVYLSKGDNSENATMYLELRVPFKHIQNERTIFMLLPGYERKRDYWRNLIDFSVNCSDSAIFVFSESSFARADNDRLLENVKKTFEKKLIYVISHSDTSIDGNKEVKKTCIEVMKIPSEEEDRVICAGSYNDKTKNGKWINELMYAVNKYCTEAGKIEQKCSEYVCREIENVIIPSIGKIREVLSGYSSTKIFVSLDHSEWLDAFQKIVDRERKKYKANLDIAINSALNDSNEKLDCLFTNKQYAKNKGLKRSRARRAIFGSVPEDLIQAQKIVEESLIDDKTKRHFIEGHFIGAIDETMNQIEQGSVVKKMLENNDSGNNELFAANNNQEDLKVLAKTNELKGLCMDVVNFLDKGRDTQFNMSGEPVELLETVAEIGTHYFAVGTISSVASTYGSRIENMKLSKPNIDLQDIVKGADNTKKFGLSILGVAGIDAADGTFDLVGAVAKQLGVSMGIATTGVIGVLGAGAGVVIMKDINRMRSDDFTSCKNALNSIYNQMESQYLDLYDEYMRNIKEKIERMLIDESRVNQKAALAYNVQRSLNSIEDIIGEIFDSIVEEKYGLQSSF